VSNTSQPQDCITISSDLGIIAQEITTIDTSTWNMSSSASSYYYTGMGAGGSTDTITISNGGTGISNYTIGSLSTSSGTVSIGTISGAGTGYNWGTPEEFVNCLPDFNRVQAMCEQYPGLKIAYEKFVTTYKLVKDDYDSPKD